MEALSRQKDRDDLVDDSSGSDGAAHDVTILAECTGQGRDCNAGQDQRNTRVRHEGQSQIFAYGYRCMGKMCADGRATDLSHSMVKDPDATVAILEELLSGEIFRQIIAQQDHTEP